MRKRLAAVVLLLPLVALACGDDDDEDDAAASGSASASEPAAEEEAAGGDGGLAVTAVGFAFDPTELEAAAGDVTIELTNEDDADHTFTIEELDIDVAAGGGESASGDATLEAGEYEYVCRIHPAMQGTLTVS